MQRFCQCASQSSPLVAYELSRRMPVKKILVIDDDVVMRTFVTHTLSKAGYEPIEASDGTVGIEISRHQRPDLILTDVVMDGMTGYEMLAAMRQDPATAAVPIILMTSLADTGGMRQGMELGADDYLAKPVSAATLLAAIEVQGKKQALIQERSEKSLRQLRSNLIHTLPHELNTPLNGILGFAELLKSSADSLLPHEIAEMADYITISANRLHRVARNYLAYARTEMLETDPEGTARLQQCKTENASAIIDRVARSTAETSERTKDFSISVPDMLALRIDGDDLRQIVDELVQNACKFSKAGTPVKVIATKTATGVAIAFSDRGRGMNPEQMGNIEAYSQFEREVHAHEGLGLGLVISKRLASLYSGSLRIESTANVGTTVTVSLPSFEVP